ncbi:ligand-gated ion channel [Ovoidimarina sediminis]|uniref:hypothetical protein n=1 Tax=Ovoidimarina sediminis TaxID=3079856 RepID=UPI00290E9AA3|nr:hypothetical protein [Rhodophyticola sp. MJ-SS7]MDU8944278.1 hypothetical protein [Rhodophyticola sp. MJ-SS7]
MTILALILSTNFAMALCELPLMRTDQRPEPEARPTEITVSFIVSDILGVDDLNQQIEIDFFVRLIWADPRIAKLKGCRFQRAKVWTPDIYVYNSSNARSRLEQAREQVVVREDGLISYRQRLTGRFSSYHNLEEFPFDSQNFRIVFGPINSDASELFFRIDESESWLADRLNLEGWTVDGISIQSNSNLREVDGRNVSTVTLTISATRNAMYYVLRIMVPLSFVVAMSWFIFWVPPTRFEFQIGLGATSMLTMIAFMLSISGSLPALGYLTVLDKILIWSISLVFLSMTEALISGLLVLTNREKTALKLDRLSRILAPALLALGWSLIWHGII